MVNGNDASAPKPCLNQDFSPNEGFIGSYTVVCKAVIIYIYIYSNLQKQLYYNSEVEIKYHDSGNGRTFILVSARKNSINVFIGGVGMLLSPRALKSLNNIEKIQPRLMVATFNSNPSTTIISCYSPTNVRASSPSSTSYLP